MGTTLFGIFALMFIGVGSNLWVARGSSARIVQRPEDVTPHQVAIVLGAGLRHDGTPSRVLEDRLATALTLYQLGRTRSILVSGGPSRSGGHEVDAMRAWLRAQGVPAEVIQTDRFGLRTRATMQRAVSTYGIHEAALCTQRFHLPRSLYLARRAGMEAVGVAADRHIYQRARHAGAREWFARIRALLDEILATDSTP